MSLRMFGNVITIEPGIYLPGFAGIRIEDDVLINSNAEIFFGYPTILKYKLACHGSTM